jgi:hypothetical protein
VQLFFLKSDQFTEIFPLTAGYRVSGADYDKGVYAERFIFHSNEFGPVIRPGFIF